MPRKKQRTLWEPKGEGPPLETAAENSSGPRIYTIGHSTRSLSEFLALLEEHGVRRVCDVRRYPGSRRYPHFGTASLAQSLGKHEIDYVHEPDLGGRRTPREDSPNGYWRSASFRAYADYMSTPEFLAALERLQEQARDTISAIMCAEAVPWSCHRQLISDQLVTRGWKVLHSMAPHHADVHVLNPAARLLPDWRIVYPATP